MGFGSPLDVMSRWGGGESLGLPSGARAQPPRFLGAAKATGTGGPGHAGHVLGQQGPNPRAPGPLRAGTAREKPPGSLLHPRPGCCFLPITITLGRRRPSADSKSCPRHPPATAASTLSGAAAFILLFCPHFVFRRGAGPRLAQDRHQGGAGRAAAEDLLPAAHRE